MDALHYHDTLTGQYYLHPREVQAVAAEVGIGESAALRLVQACLRRAYDREVADERA